jgi:hypothetical protein
VERSLTSFGVPLVQLAVRPATPAGAARSCPQLRTVGCMGSQMHMYADSAALALARSPPSSVTASPISGSLPKRSLLFDSHDEYVSSATKKQGLPPVAHEPFIIGVAGGTASGKTTVCNQIMQNLHDQRVAMISMDSFYRGLTDAEKVRRSGSWPPTYHAVLWRLACLSPQVQLIRTGTPPSVVRPLASRGSHRPEAEKVVRDGSGWLLPCTERPPRAHRAAHGHTPDCDSVAGSSAPPLMWLPLRVACVSVYAPSRGWRRR